MGIKNPLSTYQRVPLVLKGLKRIQRDSKRLRTPITTLVLFSIRAQLDLCAYNDQFRRSYTLVFAKCNSVLCPVIALMGYLDRRGLSHGPLFSLQDGSPLTRVKLSEFIQKTTQATGWSTHKFWIGAATAAAMLSVSDYIIKALGR